MAADRESAVEALVVEMPWFVSTAVRYQIAIADQLGMPVADVHAVGALLEFGPTGPQRLAELMGMTPGAVTRLADRLERAGYVRRDSDPADRRRITLSVVPDRVAEIARFYEPMARHWRAQLARGDDDELRFLLEFLRRGRAYTQAETAALRANGRPHGTRQRPS